MSATKAKIKTILNQNFEIPMETLEQEDTSLQFLGLDSLDFADVVLELEKTAGKKVILDGLRHVKTLGELYAAIEWTLASSSESESTVADL